MTDIIKVSKILSRIDNVLLFAAFFILFHPLLIEFDPKSRSNFIPYAFFGLLILVLFIRSSWDWEITKNVPVLLLFLFHLIIATSLILNLFQGEVAPEALFVVAKQVLVMLTIVVIYEYRRLILRVRFLSVLHNVLVVGLALSIILKLTIHGQDEKVFVGFLTHQAGQVVGILVALVFLLECGLYRGRYWRNGVILFILISFVVVNEKRVGLLALTSVVLLLTFVRGRNDIRVLLSGVAVSALALLAITSMIPSLNPDRTMFGSIDLVYLKNYIKNYFFMAVDGPMGGSSADFALNNDVQDGRFVLMAKVFNYLVSKAELLEKVFGHGAYSIVDNGYTGGSGVVEAVLGTRGVFTGAGRVLYEFGFFGLCSFCFIFLSILIKLLRDLRPRDAGYSERRILMIFAVTFIWLDWVFYSIMSNEFLPLIVILATLASSVLQNDGSQPEPLVATQLK